MQPNQDPPHDLDRELGRRLSVAIAYIGKRGGDFIAWTDIGGEYGQETRALPDGRSLPVFVLTNSTAARRFLLTNPDSSSLTHNGLVMAVGKRVSVWMAGGRLLRVLQGIGTAGVQ